MGWRDIVDQGFMPPDHVMGTAAPETPMVSERDLSGGSAGIMVTRWLGYPIAAAGLLVVMTVTVYLPAMHGQFVWDDLLYITENPRVVSPDGLRDIWVEVGAEDYRPQYYPLTLSVFWLEYQLWGPNPFGYHLVNVLLHALNAVLLWRVLRLLKLPGAWFAGAIFAVHPVHVQSVAWICELKNVFSMMFFLLSSFAFIRFFKLDEPEPTVIDENRCWNHRWWYVSGLILFVCALMSKTATAVLPLGLLTVLWWKRHRVTRDVLAGLMPLVLLAVAFSILTVYLEENLSNAQGEFFSYTIVEKCLIAGRALCFYVGKLAWPYPIIFVYPRWQIDANVWWQYLYPVVVLVTVGVLWVFRIRLGRGPMAAVIFFILAVAPVSFVSVAFTQHAYVANHWQYWATMGLIAVVAAGATRLVQRRRPLHVVIVLVVTVTLATLTWRQAGRYDTAAILWTDTLRDNPDAWTAHSNLGTLYQNDGRLDDAIRHFHAVLRIKPNQTDTMFNLGNALRQQGHLDDAIIWFRRAVQRDPNEVDFRNNLATALANQMNYQEAIWHLRRVLANDPNSGTAHFNLSIILRRIGKIKKAQVHLQEAIRLKPELAGSLQQQ